MCKKDEGIVMPNFVAPRAAVFSLSTKKPRGGGADIRLTVRVNCAWEQQKKYFDYVAPCGSVQQSSSLNVNVTIPVFT